MYINRSAEEIFKQANLALSLKFFDNLIKTSIKEVAKKAGVSEKQLHFWKNLLEKEGPKVFSSLKPGRKKEYLSFLEPVEKLLIYETVNHLLVDEKKYEGKNRKFSAEVKEKILKERGRLKEEYSLPYENFSKLLGFDSGSTRLWSRKLRQEGREGLKDRSRAPKRRPKKLPQELIDEIVAY
ncbi:MAG: hypothetical protein DDT40_01275 [candidate division WS2 bacterium]|nr:hypothetical protein [Candidatus Psychracetigena formicireducens]